MIGGGTKLWAALTQRGQPAHLPRSRLGGSLLGISLGGASRGGRPAELPRLRAGGRPGLGRFAGSQPLAGQADVARAASRDGSVEPCREHPADTVCAGVDGGS